MNGVEFRYLCGNTDHSGALEEAGVLEADAIIIGPADDLSDNEVRGFALTCLVIVECVANVHLCLWHSRFRDWIAQSYRYQSTVHRCFP